MNLPCQTSDENCWAHHPGSTDCIEFRPRACTNQQIIDNQRDADFAPKRDCEPCTERMGHTRPACEEPCNDYEDEEALR